jgi:hypothetical protein
MNGHDTVAWYGQKKSELVKERKAVGFRTNFLESATLLHIKGCLYIRYLLRKFSPYFLFTLLFSFWLFVLAKEENRIQFKRHNEHSTDRFVNSCRVVVTSLFTQGRAL